VKCSWGKEAGDPANVSNQQQYGYGSIASSQYPYGYGQQMGYWYPQGYPTTQMQSQFLQGMQGYSYGNYGFQQGYMGVGADQSSTATAQPQAGQEWEKLKSGRNGQDQREWNVGTMQGAMTSWGQGITGGSTLTAAQHQAAQVAAGLGVAQAASAAAQQQPTAAAAAGMMAAAAAYPVQQFQAQ
jgi:hypothetical protein